MSNAVIGALRVNLAIDTAAFRDGLIAAQKELASASGRMKAVGKSLSGIGQDLSLKVTAPLTLFGALTLRTAGEFEAAMNRVGAATGAADGEMAALADMARDLGKSTVFSAGQAAGAIEMLAKNGLDVGQIMGGALRASLDLAAASGVDLAAAADVATDVMANFKKGAGDLAGVVDGVSGVLIASKFGFDDYRLALAQAGGVAGGLGVTLEDFNAVIAATSARFASGSDAGTSFKTFLQRLVPQSKDAAAAMQALGLEFFSAGGDLKTMREIAQELQDGLAGLSDEARSEALTAIFGTDAMRTAIGLMEQGADGIAALDAAIRKASAADQAAARMKGWTGEMTKLVKAVEELQLAIAGAGLLETATRIVTALAGIVDRMSEANPRLLQFGVVAAALAAAVGPVAMVLGGVATAAAALTTPIGLAVTAVAALAAAGTALYLNWEAVRTGFPEAAAAVETGIDLVAMQLQAIGTIGAGGIETAALGLRSLGALLTGDLSGAWTSAQAAADRFNAMLGDVAEIFVPGARAALAEFGTAAQDIVGQAVTAVAALAAAGTALYLNWEAVRTGFPEAAAAVETGIDLVAMQLQAIGTIGAGGIEPAALGLRSLGALLTGDLSGAWTSAQAAADRFNAMLGDVAEIFVPGAKAALTEFGTAAQDIVGQAVTWVVEAVAGIPDRLVSVAQVLREVGVQLIDGLWEGMKARWQDLKGWVWGLIPELPQWFRDAWGIHSPSTVMAGIGEDLMAGLSQGLDGQMDGIRSGVDGFARDIAGVMRGVLFEGQSLRESLGELFGGWGESLLSSGLSGLGKLIGIPGFAAGTRSAPGGVARINELGGEIVNLPRGAQVIPHDLSRRMVDLAARRGGPGGQPGTIAVTVTGARGNAEVMAMVEAGVRQGLRGYDRALSDRIAGISEDPYYRG